MVHFFDNIDPWIFLTLGVGLIIIDLLYGLLYLSILGLCLIVNGIGSAIGLNTETRLFLMFLSALVAVPFYRRVLNKGDEGSIHTNHFTFSSDDEGKIIWVDPDDSNIGRAAISGKGEWLVRSETSDSLIINDRVAVVRKDSSVLVVTSISNNG